MAAGRSSQELMQVADVEQERLDARSVLRLVRRVPHEHRIRRRDRLDFVRNMLPDEVEQCLSS